MLHEFAIQPEMLIDWSALRAAFAYFSRSFGIGEARIVSRYPEHWKRLVLDAWQVVESSATTESEKGILELRRTRLLELLQVLSATAVDRSRLSFTKTDTWLDNAKRHAPEHLQTLIVRNDPAAPTHPIHIISGDEIYESPRWNLEKSRIIARSSAGIVNCIRPMLERSQNVIFIDPYFGPGSDGHLATMGEFLKILRERKGMAPPITVSIYTTNKKDIKGGWSAFENNCKATIEPRLSQGWRVNIAWLNEKDPKIEKVHNRYVLTDLGGVVLGSGLEARSRSSQETDDVSLMSREQYETRWAQFTTKLSDNFVVENRAVLEGKPSQRPKNGPHGGPRRSK